MNPEQQQQQTEARSYEDEQFERVFGDIDDGEVQVQQAEGDEPADGEVPEKQSAAEPTAETEPRTEEPEGERKEDTRPVGRTRFGTHFSEQGHLVDEEGNIVAAAGKPRKIYEQNVRLIEENGNLRNSLSDYKKAWDATAEVVKTVNQSGLQADQVKQAIEVYKSFLSDPGAAAQRLIAQAQSMGYNLDSENPGVPSLGAISNLIDQKLQALKPGAEFKDPGAETPESQAYAVYKDFMDRYPDAAIHENDLGELMNRNPQLTLHDAYTRLLHWARSNQLDWEKPLIPQYLKRVDAAKQSAPSPEQSNGSQPKIPQKPMTPGRPMRDGDMNLGSQPEIASPDESFDNIIRKAMANTFR